MKVRHSVISAYRTPTGGSACQQYCFACLLVAEMPPVVGMLVRSHGHDLPHSMASGINILLEQFCYPGTVSCKVVVGEAQRRRRMIGCTGWCGDARAAQSDATFPCHEQLACISSVCFARQHSRYVVPVSLLLWWTNADFRAVHDRKEKERRHFQEMPR